MRAENNTRATAQNDDIFLAVHAAILKPTGRRALSVHNIPTSRGFAGS